MGMRVACSIVVVSPSSEGTTESEGITEPKRHNVKNRIVVGYIFATKYIIRYFWGGGGGGGQPNFCQGQCCLKWKKLCAFRQNWQN